MKSESFKLLKSKINILNDLNDKINLIEWNKDDGPKFESVEEMKEFEEKVIGEAVIRETFKVSKVGTIGGFMVTNGKITRDSSARVIRDGVVIFDGKLASLKHYKDDVKEVGNAQEGGLTIENYNDIKVDDVIEAYIMEEIKR